MFAQRRQTKIFGFNLIGDQIVSYKTISSCIISRILSTLDYLISETQSRFVKGRCKRENIRFIYDIIAYSESKNIPGLSVLIDFEKAFDSISW